MLKKYYVIIKSLDLDLLLLLSILLIPSWHFNGIYDAFQWTTGLTILAIILILSNIVYLPLLCFVISGIQITKNMTAFLMFPTLNHEPWPTFAMGLYASLSCLLIGGFAIKSASKYKDVLPDALKYFTLANAWYVIIGAAFEFGRLPQGVGMSGFISYASTNAALIVAGLPFIDKKPQQLFVCVMAVLLAKSSIPFGMLALWAAMEVIKVNKVRVKTVFLSVCAGVSALIVGFFTVGYTLFDSAYRFQFYRLLYGHWKKDGLYFFGNGIGTFTGFAREVQIEENFLTTKDNLHLLWNAHSDWLQILIEGGLFSLFCAGVFVLIAGYKLYTQKKFQHLISFVLILSCMVFSAPLRYFPFALFSGLILFSWVGQLAPSNPSRSTITGN